ncbi:hypothetical protein PAXINDRAFT_13962 [Paxillus involutus ATCC 200175]|uniref:Uncharacterized protein n=1 Tax=Paxillus involutus ATCC 200175 TaxID=664439 RepID=A0A0C9U0E5_PAXIN|nr:hypothetical protein PAXINDRAFT_13962 [Paxillus involutus ATCC 200175]
MKTAYGRRAVTFSPSGEFVACGESRGKVSIWRVPRWDDSKEAYKWLSDVRSAQVFLQRPSHGCRVYLPAVTVLRYAASDLDRQPDYLNLPTNRHPSPSRTRLHTTHAPLPPHKPPPSAGVEPPSQLQRSVG